MTAAPTTDPKRHIWKPREEIYVEWIVGQLWPVLFVNLFEENGIGERRLIGSKVYVAQDDSDASTE